MAEWKDVTSYSRGDTTRTPTTYEARSGSLRVVVTCGHIHHRPNWVMYCFALSIDTLPLAGSSSLEEAKSRAIDIVIAEAEKIHRDAILLK